MVGRKFVALYVRVRFSSVTPKERWVSGLNQQFTKLPIQKVREFESHSFRMKNDKLETNKRVNRIVRIRKIIRENGACLICVRRWNGGVKKYRTNC
jgi:hypothetical protein